MSTKTTFDPRFCAVVICEKKPTWIGRLFVKAKPDTGIDVRYCDDHAKEFTQKAADNGQLRMVLTPAPKPEFQTQSPDRFKKNDIVQDDKGNHFRVTQVKGSHCNVESVVTKEVWTGRKRSEFTRTDRVAM